MGLEELLGTLKKNEQHQIEEIWQAVRSEAETLRQQVSEEITAITKKQAEQLASACQRSRRSIFSEAEIETRSKKLFAYQALEGALLNAAMKHLPHLRALHYERVFRVLVNELPDRQWEKISVNPEDQQLAAEFFPADIIQPDPAISGGLIATTADGRISVDNSFEKRLERQWFRILPRLIETIEKQYGASRSAENSR